ncbi:MAG: TetR/AcrR family transcriptional regulator [Dehalococcoidia bacterium]
MAEVKKTRREKAEFTRLRILQAAREEFAEKGYHGATMASIAERARVAGQTVYFVFHTKSQLISQLVDLLVTGTDPPEIPQETEWWAAMRADHSAAEALCHFIRGAAPLFARASAIAEVLRAAALTDPEVHETYAHHEQLRYTGFREVIELIVAKGKLRGGLDLESATDVLLAVLSDSTYYQLTVERGWSADRFTRWACDALPAMLLDA